MEATQSQQFKRWFGDWQNKPNTASKVVNDDGTPKVVYHGTDAESIQVLQIEEADSEMGYVPTKAELAAPTESASDNSIHTSSEKARAKKEPAALLPKIAGSVPITLTGSKISISNLPDYVNEYFPAIWPEINRGQQTGRNFYNYNV